MTVHEKRDPNQFPPHMRGDEVIRNENIDAGRDLCERCGGSGNELLSMYKACSDCGGRGYIAED